jgi:hypothetical protein
MVVHWLYADDCSSSGLSILVTGCTVKLQSKMTAKQEISALIVVENEMMSAAS